MKSARKFVYNKNKNITPKRGWAWDRFIRDMINCDGTPLNCSESERRKHRVHTHNLTHTHTHTHITLWLMNSIHRQKVFSRLGMEVLGPSDALVLYLHLLHRLPYFLILPLGSCPVPYPNLILLWSVVLWGIMLC